MVLRSAGRVSGSAGCGVHENSRHEADRAAAPGDIAGGRVRIALQLDQDTASVVSTRLSRQGPSPRGYRALPIEQALSPSGVVMHPVHPGATDALLTPYFFIDVPDDADIAGLLDVLQRTPGVEAAYVEPSASPPMP
jgi:hypothetical protein